MQNFFLLRSQKKSRSNELPGSQIPNGIITKPPALIQIPYQYSAEKIEARKKVLMTLGYSASQ